MRFRLALLACCLAVPYAQAQQVLPETVVTATRVPTDLARVGSAITVLDEEDLEPIATGTVLDALRQVPGVSISRTGNLGNTSEVRLRGGESNFTLVLIDGVEVNNPGANSAFDFANLPISEIARIEILRGPQGLLYGSDAVGGVVNIITKRGAGPWLARGRAEYGSHDTWRASAGIGGGFESFDAAIDAEHVQSNGISAGAEGSEQDGWDADFLSARIGVQPTEGLRFDLVGRLADSEVETDFFAPFDDDGVVETEQQFVRLSSDFDLLDGRLTTEIGAAWSFTEQAFTGGFATEGEKAKLDLQSDLAIGADDVLTVALETEEDIARDNSGFDFSRRTNAALAQYQLGLFDSLYLTAGVRVDDDSQFGEFVTYRVTAAYLVDATGTKLRGSIGTGFKAPTATDLTDNPAFGFIGNPDLVPEESTGFDVGVEQTLLDGRLTLGLTYFHTDTENLIQIVGNTAENVGEATAQGVEAELSFRPSADWDIGASYTWSQAENLDTDSLLFRRPRHSAGLTVDYRPIDDLRLHLGVTYAGEQRDRDFSVFPAAVVTLDDYTLVTLGGSYDITPNLQVYGRVDNLLDEDYQEVFGFGTQGRTVLVGLSARL